MNHAELAAFKRSYGVLGEAERRTFSLARSKMTNTGNGDGRLKIVGHAAVFGSPSVELRSQLGGFVEYIDPHAFDDVLRRRPDVVLTWDHNTLYPLARTSAGNLELSVNAHGLRFYATCSRTSYADDLRALMADGVVSQSSFTFTVDSDGQRWEERNGNVVRTVTRVAELFDVCVCVNGAYPATDSSIARNLILDYGLTHGYLRSDPDASAAKAKLAAELELRRLRLNGAP